MKANSWEPSQQDKLSYLGMVNINRILFALTEITQSYMKSYVKTTEHKKREKNSPHWE